MDIYTASEEAYKRGFEAGLSAAGTMRWCPGRDVPDGVERALIQKRGGRTYYVEGVDIRTLLQAWKDIVAWSEVRPMTE